MLSICMAEKIYRTPENLERHLSICVSTYKPRRDLLLPLSPSRHNKLNPTPINNPSLCTTLIETQPAMNPQQLLPHPFYASILHCRGIGTRHQATQSEPVLFAASADPEPALQTLVEIVRQVLAAPVASPAVAAI